MKTKKYALEMIGASLSEPHTYRYYEKIAVLVYVCVCVCVCMCVCVCVHDMLSMCGTRVCTVQPAHAAPAIVFF